MLIFNQPLFIEDLTEKMYVKVLGKGLETSSIVIKHWRRQTRIRQISALDSSLFSLELSVTPDSWR